MNWKRTARLGIFAAAALAIGTAGASLCGLAAPPRPAVDQQAASSATPTPPQEIPAAFLIDPAQFEDLLAHAKEKPAVVDVGVKFLFDSAHVPGAIYAGPGSSEKGLAALQEWAQSASRDKLLVIYCGCCPWDKCPNIRPAFAALRKMGFTQIKVVHIARDFATDWVGKDFP